MIYLDLLSDFKIYNGDWEVDERIRAVLNLL